METPETTSAKRGVKIQWDLEARIARRRLYPVTFLYTAYCLTMLAFGLRTGNYLSVLVFFALGVVLWTLTEYFAHRFVLHGRFADGPGAVQHFLHQRFDHLHWGHHERPWDGMHISGTVGDTIHFAGFLAAVSLLAPLHTAPMLIAGLLQSYVVEEWVHHSVHYCRFKSPYFRYIKRHHLYHHSPKGGDVGYGLTNGAWDIILQTRIPAEERRRLYATPGQRDEVTSIPDVPLTS